ncbi:MAG: hypothetical protein IJU20_00335 [Clostridia bacterium]|nr:hypothetical protein [Clostridia bacterium]
MRIIKSIMITVIVLLFCAANCSCSILGIESKEKRVYVNLSLGVPGWELTELWYIDINKLSKGEHLVPADSHWVYSYVSPNKEGKLIGHRVDEQNRSNGFIRFSFIEYYDIEGFYCGETKVLDGKGYVCDYSAFKSILEDAYETTGTIDITAHATEKRVGESVRLELQTEDGPRVVKVTIGKEITGFPVIDDSRFLGWKEIDARLSFPVKYENGSIFHLFMLNPQEMKDSYTLIPIYQE